MDAFRPCDPLGEGRPLGDGPTAPVVYQIRGFLLQLGGRVTRARRNSAFIRPCFQQAPSSSTGSASQLSTNSQAAPTIHDSSAKDQGRWQARLASRLFEWMGAGIESRRAQHPWHHATEWPASSQPPRISFEAFRQRAWSVGLPCQNTAPSTCLLLDAEDDNSERLQPKPRPNAL